MSCSPAKLASNARYRLRNQDVIRQRAAEKYKANKSEILKRHAANYRKRMSDPIYRQRAVSNGKAYREQIKRKVLKSYGERCACCGESLIEFLAIDHIDGDGAEHRRAVGNDGGFPFYLWLIRNDFPPGFQTLCHNCNVAKGQYKTCPHRRTDT